MNLETIKLDTYREHIKLLSVATAELVIVQTGKKHAGVSVLSDLSPVRI